MQAMSKALSMMSRGIGLQSAPGAPPSTPEGLHQHQVGGAGLGVMRETDLDLVAVPGRRAQGGPEPGRGLRGPGGSGGLLAAALTAQGDTPNPERPGGAVHREAGRAI